MKQIKTKKRSLIFLMVSVLLCSFLLTGCGKASPYKEEAMWAYAGEGEEKQVDCFLICPTIYFAQDDVYNMGLEDEEVKSAFVGALNMEKGIYSEQCRMYAPFYRQAALEAYDLTGEAKEECFDLAYEDVEDAFLYYMKHENEGRPFILAGFSQGAEMCLRLMEEHFDKKKYQEQLVACYAIGWRVTEEEMQKYPHLKFAEGEDDTGVIVAFNSESDEITDSLMIPAGTKTLAINPLNWKTDGTAADKSLNKGACFTDYSGEIYKEIPQLTGAYIDNERGALKITDVTPEEYPPILTIFEDGIYHLYDYQFFYRNLQENVKVRCEAFAD